jgi:cellulose synthase (UDP-forming)
MNAKPGRASVGEAAVEPAAVVGGPPRRSRLVLEEGSNAAVRVTGVLFLAVMAGHLVWLVNAFNTGSPVMAAVFAAGIAIVDIYALLSIVNSWNVDRPVVTKLPHGEERLLAVLIPTCGEPVEMVTATLRSVLDQQWPRKKLVIVVGDDRNDPAIRRAVRRLRAEYRFFTLHYHVPPTKQSAQRRGEAKAGNLNSCLTYALTVYPSIELVETRDADDLVGSPEFLRYAVGHLLAHPDASFVQTIKRGHVPEGDPFSNQEPVFYERVMPMRQAANATFPCGSGLVWRLEGLKLIGGFPTWNLVEDLQSGFELLRLGGKGLYIPMVGALGQIAPEDLPNLYKQRGTWALDSARLLIWKNPLVVRGLIWRQRLQFFELNFSYVASFAVLCFIASIIGSLVASAYPTTGGAAEFMVATALLALASEGYYRMKAGHVSYRDQWRSRQVWTGLMYVYMASFFRALAYGPNRKPRYVVTRKHPIGGWHWKPILPQLLTVGALLAAIVYRMGFADAFTAVDAVGVFWALFFVYSLLHIVRLSWFRATGPRTAVIDVGPMPAPPPVLPAEPVAERASA